MHENRSGAAVLLRTICAAMALVSSRVLLAALAATQAIPVAASEISSPNAFTFYAGRISAEETWHDVLLKPWSSHYTNSYLATAAYSRTYRETREGALRTEFEINATYNFGDQSHWELNVAPISLRWQRFPWSHRLRTTAAFGVGLSYAFEFPRLEYELENDTRQLLVFWLLEITAGPREGPWSAVLRLHHRSPAWGAMGVADGGMNAPSLGIRFEF
jgi:hypothetical protein